MTPQFVSKTMYTLARNNVHLRANAWKHASVVQLSLRAMTVRAWVPTAGWQDPRFLVVKREAHDQKYL